VHALHCVCALVGAERVLVQCTHRCIVESWTEIILLLLSRVWVGYTVQVLNSLDLDMVRILDPLVQKWSSDESVHAVLLKGTGEKVRVLFLFFVWCFQVPFLCAPTPPPPPEAQQVRLEHMAACPPSPPPPVTAVARVCVSW
jgi:hypothetical protein